MRKSALVVAALALTLAIVPAVGSASPVGDSTPYGREDNAIGTLRWLPRNANEKPTGANVSRLVVVYDTSRDEAGASIPLKAKGAFGVKMFTTNQVDVKMKGHSAKVGDLNTFTGQSLPAQANETAIAVYGDVRDGACSKAGTPAFSAAYSTTRTFFHAGSTPYAPVTAPGVCEIVDSSTEVRDASGQLLGFTTTATNHVPGFYVDVEWATRTVTGGLATNAHLLAEIWYGAAYDSAGDPGPFPNGVDTTGASKSVGSPGDYDAVYTFTANPGGTGAACVDTTGSDIGAPGSWMDVKIQVPADAKKLTFSLFPKGDWDLKIIDPDGTERVSGWAGGFREQVIAPGSGSQAFPEIIPGEYTMRACNFTGEMSTFGAVIIEK